jgi:hypothetical protein
MLLGQLLFLVAALSIVGATAVGVVLGVGKIVLYKFTGRKFGPLPEKGSSEWRQHDAGAKVDLAQQSLLTEGVRRTTDDPVVVLEDERYRVIRLGPAQFLVSQVSEARRVGTFELVGEGRYRDVVAAADDTSAEKLVRDVAKLASITRRSDGRVAPGGHEEPQHGRAEPSHSH